MKLQFPWQKTQLVQACIAFSKLKLWEIYENLDFFVVETPLEDPVVVSIMGGGGCEYGLSVFRGEDAFRQPVYLYTQDMETATEKINTLGFSMSNYEDMDYMEKKWLKSCNFRAHKRDWVPSVLAKRPGESMELIEKHHDIQLMLYVLKGILKSHENGQFDPDYGGKSGSKLMTIEVSGEAMDPDVRVTRKSFPGSKELLELWNQEIYEEDSIFPDISRLPRRNETWILLPIYDIEIPDDDSECLILIAEEKSQLIYHAEPAEMDVSFLLEILADVFSGNNALNVSGIPKRIVIPDKDLFKSVREALEEWDIEVCFQANHPAAVDIEGTIRRDFPAFAARYLQDMDTVPDVDMDTIPQDDDLDGWKKIQKVLSNDFHAFWDTDDRLRKARPSRQFFGDSDWDYYIDEYNNLMVLPSYVTWGALCWKPKKHSLTYADELLREELSVAFRMSLDVLNKAYPSLYQIQKTDPETGFMTVEDLLLSGKTTIHDYGLSKSAQTGWVIPLWISSLGKFHFVDVAGPPFGPLEITGVIETLQELQLPTEPTPSWLRENAHVFGRLWKLRDDLSQASSETPDIRNTDGEPMELSKAFFACKKPQHVQDALMEREDFEYDQEQNEFVWCREKPNQPELGLVTQARLSFEGNRIIAETNSQARLDRLIHLLEELPTVRFLNYESSSVKEMMQKRPAKSLQKDNPVPQEVLDAVGEQMHDYYMKWIDMPIPALGNKSPRETAKTPQGAQKVKILIQSIDPPQGPGWVSVPKEEMLKELNLA
ncbi:MAG: DUF2384 domain-containing protein [Sedimentisphaerales bacterium]|nr:DUF2384 domain-containing protein [Sedimentisphaerales bacterium]